MTTTPRIFAFHLLNDRSGSPKVLRQILTHWAQEGKDVHLVTNQNKDGFLAEIKGVTFHRAWYKFQSNPWLRLLFYTFSQLVVFFKMWPKIKKNDLIYVNTVLPFGAALIGKLKGCRVVYHIHESTVNPAILKWFLFKMVRWSASDIINVSEYVAKAHGITTLQNHLVYNAIDDKFLEHARKKNIVEKPSNVLMVCSLKKYKGVLEFIQLAHDQPLLNFKLVLNATKGEIDLFFGLIDVPANVEIFSSQKNLHPFFSWADVILNLSRPDGWIETFGLTIIEGMAYGLPALVPEIGGITEVIEDGKTGFTVDSRKQAELNQKLQLLMNDLHLYQTFADAAYRRLETFKEQFMLQKINQITTQY
jgi:glycosyltransferase involved in cell wall biosynthesis